MAPAEAAEKLCIAAEETPDVGWVNMASVGRQIPWRPLKLNLELSAHMSRV